MSDHGPRPGNPCLVCGSTATRFYIPLLRWLCRPHARLHKRAEPRLRATT